jgi:hypothetical protein
LKLLVRLLFLTLGLASLSATAGPAAASPTFVPVASLSAPVRITTHGSGLVLTCNWPFGVPNNFCAVAADGSVSPFSAVAGFTRVPDPVETPAGAAAYGPGSVYFSDDEATGVLGAPPGPRQLYKISADGSVVTPFATMPNDDPVSCLAFDTTGRWGGLLYAATELGEVYAVLPTGAVHLVASFAVPWPLVYTEGLTIMPVDPALGPWSGAILLLHVTNGGAPGSGIVTAITYSDHAQHVTNWSTGDLKSVISLTYIPAVQNCYVASYGTGKVLGITASDMAPFVGQVLACVRDDPANQGVWAIRWNGAAFVAAPVIVQPGSRPEGAVFSASSIGGL